ncbi:sodium:proton antiporter [Salinibacter sp. 10B]|uniref:Na+/H+ antiporter NhaC family protein n=1 Tax=Salinibacter sp. 10B TaxID=1923971 RepID=UPI000CF39445|nr:Na+/H+ antiporter NhaC family protein [Salinibacter sp. 10B]PQJ34020.1 sodium:proton antiporter [Salinibacter sp. 10B]
MTPSSLTRAVFVVLGALFLVASPAVGQGSGTMDVPSPVLTGIEFTVTVPGDSALAEKGAPMVQVGGETQALSYDASQEQWTVEGVTVASNGGTTVEVVAGGQTLRSADTRAIPGWLSIVPPLLAIGMALLYRRVVPALFFGVWIGAVLAIGYTPWAAFKGLLDTMQVYVLGALANESHAAIILFSLMIGGMVGIISKNGGTLGIVERLTGWASDSRRGQVATWALGLGIFFDDYANTLIVGNTMRPVTDRLRISREKLAYIVDSTAAPISCLAFVTTWIGYEVGLVGTAIEGIEGFNQGAYSVFLNSIPYSFYPLLALFFVFLIAYSRRDFGPMYHAEKRARETGQVLGPDANVDEAAAEGDELSPPADAPNRAVNAVIPVVVLIGTVLAGLYATGAQAAGADASLREIIGGADSYAALMWGSLIGVLTAAALSLGQGILDLEQTVEAWYEGLKSMLFAMIILVLAWALSNITEVLHTADYLVSILGEWLPAGVVPAIIFVIAAATAFATGSSWGTMGILMPLVVPLAWAVLAKNGMASPDHYHILYSSVSCVLAGAVWGDHCSPISDTTILSSMASGCDHIDHVRTQLPYAMSVGLVALLLGTLPTGFGLPWWVSLSVGVGVLVTLHRVVGTPIETAKPPFETSDPVEASAAG